MENMEFTAIKMYSSEEPKAKTNGNINIQGTYTQHNLDGNTYTYNGETFEANSDAEQINGLCFYIQLTDEDMATIKEVTISFDPMPDGIQQINGDVKAVDVYSINGIKVGEFDKNNTLQGLPKGIYIIGGKKVTN